MDSHPLCLACCLKKVWVNSIRNAVSKKEDWLCRVISGKAAAKNILMSKRVFDSTNLIHHRCSRWSAMCSNHSTNRSMVHRDVRRSVSCLPNASNDRLYKARLHALSDEDYCSHLVYVADTDDGYMNMKRCLSSFDGVVYGMMICEINSSMVAEVLKQHNTTSAIEHLCKKRGEKKQN